MEKLIKKNDIELLNESLDIKLSDAFKINLGNDYLINTKLGLSFDYSGDYIGKIIGSGSSPIPSQYIVADYILMATNQYIDTGISATPRYTRSLFEVYWVGSITGTRGLYGVRNAANADSRSYCVFLTVAGTGPRWDNCGTSSLSSNWSTGEWHTVELTHSGNYGQTVDNGVIVATGNVSMGTAEYASIYLNTIYTRSNSSINTGGTTRWRTVKIWADGTTLSAEMIPVYDTVTQAGGMYDLSRKQFFGGGNPDGNTITAYDANGNQITGGNLLGMSPNMMLGSIKKPSSNVTIIGPDEEEDR